MKNLKTSLAILFAAALMVTIMAVPVFATSVTYYSDNLGYYTQGNISTYQTTSAVTVTLDIQSRKISGSSINKRFTVTIPATTTPRAVKVTDVLVKAMADNSGLYFQNSAGNNIVSGSSYLHQVVYGGVTYAPTGTGYNGWMFKVNTKAPLQSGTPGNNAYGTAINTTYVNNGDKITFYMDDPSSSSTATKFARVKSASYSSGTLTVNMQYGINYYGSPNYTWYIPDYAVLSSVTVGVYSSETSTSPLASATSNSSGVATISKTLTSGKTYYIKSMIIYNSSTGVITTSSAKEKITI